MDLLKNLDNMITAEDFLNKEFPEFEDLDNDNIWLNIEESMIEFAKLHVKKFAEIHNIKNIKYIEEIK